MATISSTGVGSGLDVNSIVSSLMSLERRPLQQLQTRAGEMQTRLSAFGQLQGQLAALGDLAARLSEPAAWQPMRVDSSKSEAVTATTATGASAGRYRVEVQQLAQSQSLASQAFASGTANVGTGQITITLGTQSPGGFTPGAAAPMQVTIDASHQTLAGVRDAINAARGPVTASIVGSGAQSRLVLRGPDGAEGAMRVTVADDDGDPLDAAGLSALAWDPDAAPGPGRQMTQTQAAQDALFTVDGLALHSPRNQAEGVVQGVTLTLRQVTTAPVDVGVSVETMALRKNVNDFVSTYNAVVRLLRQQTQADPSGKNRGPLQADGTALGLLGQLREMVRGVVDNPGGPGTLGQMGLEVLRDGTLSAQETRLSAALASPDTLVRLFTRADGPVGGQGLALRLKAWSRAVSGDGGSIAQRLQGLKGSVDANQKAQDAAEDRLARTEARLRAQYQRLDGDMSRLNAQMAQMRSSLGLNKSA